MVAWYVAIAALPTVYAAKDVFWRFSAPSMSCHESCGVAGTTCTESAWPSKQEDFGKIAKSLSIDCPTMMEGNWSGNPTKQKGICFWKSAEQRRCKFKAKGVRRFCPCIGSVAWLLGEKGTSCDRTCKSRFKTVCRHGVWPNTEGKGLAIARSLGVKCRNMLPGDSVANPLVLDGNCWWHGSGRRCSAKVKLTQRFCPCAATVVAWSLGKQGETCTSVCKRMKRPCYEKAWPQKAADLKAILKSSGIRCPVRKGGASANPSLFNDKHCYWYSKGTPSCSAKNHKAKRLCPCGHMTTTTTTTTRRKIGKPVQRTVTLKTWVFPEKLDWEVSTKGKNRKVVCSGAGYSAWYSTIEVKCVLEPGREYRLTCKDRFGEGWAGATIVFNGRHYCKGYTWNGGFEYIEELRG